MRTLVSKKSAGICLVSVEFEIGREAPAESSETFQQLIPAWLARNAELSRPGNMDFDLIALLQLKRVDDCLGEAHRQAISPL
jgi:hypothetical protein